VTEGVCSRLGAVVSVDLQGYVPDVALDRACADRKGPRYVLVAATVGEKAENLDLALRKVVRTRRRLLSEKLIDCGEDGGRVSPGARFVLLDGNAMLPFYGRRKAAQRTLGTQERLS
jgi:hypothetical protein